MVLRRFGWCFFSVHVQKVVSQVDFVIFYSPNQDCNGVSGWSGRLSSRHSTTAAVSFVQSQLAQCAVVTI